jgi:hypothetical protein
MAFMDALNNPAAAIAMSFILGLGLAIMFRPMCKDGVCKVVHGPKPASMNGHVYPFGDKCYLYSTRAVECGPEAVATD